MTTQSNSSEFFDAVYRGGAPDYSPGGRPPWSIGEPQPEIAELIAAGRVHGEVLDVGCGEAALSLRLAELGFTVVGLDFSPTAIQLARAEAARRGLKNVTFEVADVTGFSGYGGRFGTIIDSEVFHAIPVDLRDAYMEALLRAAAPGASYFALVFDRAGMPEDHNSPAYPCTADELRDAVSKYWTVDELRPARAYAKVPEGFNQPGLEQQDEPDGRKSMRAWLVCAHCD